MLDLAPRAADRAARATALTVPLIALAATLLSGTILFSLLGRSPAAVTYALFVQPLTTWNGIGELLLKTGPLLLIAQGLAVGYRAQVWNIGAEGQLIVGAIAAAALAIAFDGSPRCCCRR